LSHKPRFLVVERGAGGARDGREREERGVSERRGHAVGEGRSSEQSEVQRPDVTNAHGRALPILLEPLFIKSNV
jgi:hypothetical protein